MKNDKNKLKNQYRVNEQMAIPAILYSLMMNIVLLIYVGVVRRHKTVTTTR